VSSTIDGEKAFDQNPDTVWVSQCSPCNPDMAYIGQMFEVPALVRCVHLFQGGDKAYMPSSARLEMWDNATGSFTWRQVRLFKMLVEGHNRLSPWWGVSGTRFRVSNLDAAPGGWRVAELRLFSDPDCFERVSGMGYSSDIDPADAARAFDGDVSTFWHASCCPKLSVDEECLECDGIGAWLGIITIQNTTVNCMQVIQTGIKQPRGPVSFATTEIALQGWSGNQYELIYEWKYIPGDDWVELSVGRDHSADSVSCKNNADWERCNATGFNCSRYKEEDMCNETYQSDQDCGGVEMSFACKEACCLCGAANSGHCPREIVEEAGLPVWVIPLAAGGGALLLLALLIGGVGWKRRSCHHMRGCRGSCLRLDSLLGRRA
jgi:hypothetical protein